MPFWTFWAPAVAICILVVGLVVLGLVRGARLRAAESGEKREIRIYADQLREVERDLARGLVSAEEAERLRAETGRRLLEADRKAKSDLGESPSGVRSVAIVAALLAPLFAAALYASYGSYAYPDMPLTERYAEAQDLRAARPSQEELEATWQADPQRPAPPEAEPRFLELMEQLRTAVASRPDDLVGLRLLATNESNLGNHAAAAQAWVRVIEVQGDAADVEAMTALVENMILATGGIVSAEAEVVIERILQRDPRNGTARYYLGLMFAQTGRPDLTFRLWRGLLEDSAADAPWVPAIRQTIEELADIAGVRYTLPPLEGMGARGPSAEDMANAAQMSDAERQEMIGGMVEGLAARLANQGGAPEEWARLIGALGVLGQTDRARDIWAEARLVFADAPEALGTIDAAARQLGFTE